MLQILAIANICNMYFSLYLLRMGFGMRGCFVWNDFVRRSFVRVGFVRGNFMTPFFTIVKKGVNSADLSCCIGGLFLGKLCIMKLSIGIVGTQPDMLLATKRWFLSDSELNYPRKSSNFFNYSFDLWKFFTVV